MMKQKNIITTCIFALLLFGLALLCWFKPNTEFSESERRPLAEKPVLTLETVANGEFMDGFEEYTADQFPARDWFRKIKAYFSMGVLGKADNNGLYYADGHLSKLEYPVNPQMVDYAKERFDFLYNKYLKDTDTKNYLSLIPDKNYFLAEKNGYVSIDYDAFINDFKNRMDYMEYIDVLPLLSIDDYYRTDSHWKQESIFDVAEHIANQMGTSAVSDRVIHTLDHDFNGVYVGQSALSVKPDTIQYVTNYAIDNAIVTYYDNGMPQTGEMYNMEKALGKDPYEMFLSGTTPLVTIENPDVKTNKELIVFRDSYGSSLVPLLVPGYQKITVVDIRYIQSDFLGHFIDFTNQDVLFLYSTSLINNSLAMR